MSNVFEGIKAGLQEAIEYNKGNLKARSNTLTVMPLKEYNADEIKNIRNQLGMTQITFAGFMGVTKKTVEAWEAGRNMPDGPARRILGMVQVDPTLPQKYNIVSSKEATG